MSTPRRPALKVTDPSSWGTIRKALVAAAGSAVTALVLGIGGGYADDGHLSHAEAGFAVGAALLAAGAVGKTVYQVPND